MATETPPCFDRWADQLSRLLGPSPLRGNCLVPLFDDCTARNREAMQTFCGPAAPSRELILIIVQGRLTSGVLMRLMTFDRRTQSSEADTLTRTPPPHPPQSCSTFILKLNASWPQKWGEKRWRTNLFKFVLGRFKPRLAATSNNLNVTEALAPLWSCRMPTGWSRGLLGPDRRQPAAPGPELWSWKWRRSFVRKQQGHHFHSFYLNIAFTFIVFFFLVWYFSLYIYTFKNSYFSISCVIFHL